MIFLRCKTSLRGFCNLSCFKGFIILHEVWSINTRFYTTFTCFTLSLMCPGRKQLRAILFLLCSILVYSFEINALVKKSCAFISRQRQKLKNCKYFWNVLHLRRLLSYQGDDEGYILKYNIIKNSCCLPQGFEWNFIFWRCSLWKLFDANEETFIRIACQEYSLW